MVKMIKEKNRIMYQCEECGFKYENKELAEKCETWCQKHSSCNIEITSLGIPPKEVEF